MALDAIVKLLYQSDVSQALGGQRQLSAELVKAREQQKLAFYEERARSTQARAGIAEMIADEKRRQNELKGTTASIIALAKAEENLRRAQSQSRNAANYLQLRREEVKQAGVSGLDRIALNLGLGPNGAMMLAGGQQVGGLLGGMLPGGIGQTIGIARNFAQATGLFSEGMSVAAMATTGLTVALGAGGLVGAFMIATKSAEYLTQALEKAKQEEISAIGQSSEIQRIYEVQQAQADRFYRDLQVNTELAGKNTSVSGEEIARLNNIVLPSLLRIGKESGAGLDAVDDRVVDLTKRFAILAQATPSVTPFQITGALAAATSGQLNEAVRSQEFFKNSGLDKIIQQEAVKQGVNLASATASQQVAIFEAAMQTRVPQELIDRAQGSVVAQISSLTDTFFSPRIGIFGVMRDTVKNSSGGLIEGTSVYNSFAKVVKATIGEGGTFAQIARLLGGTDFDIMLELRNAIEGANSFLVELNALLKTLADMKDFVANIGFKAQKIPFTNQQATIGGVFNTSVDTLQRLTNPLPTLAGAAQTVGQGDLIRTLLNPFGAIANLFGWGASFAGNLPGTGNGDMSLMDAIGAELRNMPIGAKPRIANDSEYIFPRESDVFAYAASRGGGGRTINIQPGAIVVNALPGQDAHSIAEAVLSLIDQKLSLEIGGFA